MHRLTTSTIRQQLVTSDHGNAETMINDNGGPLTSHTTNPVPFIIANEGHYKFVKDASEGALCDVAPTTLDIMVSCHVCSNETMTPTNVTNFSYRDCLSPRK